MNQENKKNLLKVFELRKPSNYENDDDIKFYVKRTIGELSKIFNLNEKIKIEEFKDALKPSTMKKIIEENNADFMAYAVKKDERTYCIIYDGEKENVINSTLFDSWLSHGDTFAKVRSESEKIFILVQDYKFIEQMKETKNARTSNRNDRSDRLIIVKDFYNDYSKEQRYKMKFLNYSNKNEEACELKRWDTTFRYLNTASINKLYANNIIDKSGYLLGERREKLNRRASDLKQLREAYKMKEYNSAGDLKALKISYNKIVNYVNKFDFENISISALLIKKYGEFLKAVSSALKELNYFEKQLKNDKYMRFDRYKKDLEEQQTRLLYVSSFENYLLNDTIKNENQYFNWDTPKRESYWMSAERLSERAPKMKEVYLYLKFKSFISSIEDFKDLNELSKNALKEELKK